MTEDGAVGVGAKMVSDGIDAALVSQGNSIISVADASVNQTSTPGSMAVFHAITASYDPFMNPGVLEVIRNTSIIFIFLFSLFVFGGLGYVMVHQKFPNMGKTIDYTFFEDKPFDMMEYVKSLGAVIVFIVFGFTAVWTIMLISQVISEMMTVSALDAMMTTPNSGMVFLIMAIAYLILSVFIAIRFLVITIITSLLLILFVLWAFHIIRDVINVIFIYFLTMIFLQPILISIAAIGIMCIKWVMIFTNGTNAGFIYYLGLLIILVITAITFTLGPATVGKLIRIGTRRRL